MALALQKYQPRTHLPPGVPFILHTLATKVLPIVGGGYATITALDAAFGVSLPNFITWTVLSTAVPVVFAARTWLHTWRTRRHAARFGASIIPSWDGKLPGNYDILTYFMEEFRNGYLDDPLQPAVEELGNIFNFRVFWIDQFITIEPEHVKQLLATEFSNFEKGPEFKYCMESVLGTGVFNSDGEMWKFHRSMTRPFFSRDRINDFAIFARHADVAITLIASRLQEGCAVDFQDAAARFTLDSATDFLFGACVNSLEAGLPYPANFRPLAASGSGGTEGTNLDSAAEVFARAFGAAQWWISVRSRIGDVWPLWEVFEDKTKKHMDVVNAYIEPILQEALRKKILSVEEIGEEWAGPKTERKDGIKDDETLLDHLVKYTDDPVILKDETLNIMLAGRDTTASTLTFAVYLLAQHSDVLHKLRAEILEVVGPIRAPTLDDIRAMKYLRAVVNETLRLYPPVPFNVRSAIKDTTLAPTVLGGRPYFVPAGTSVSYSVFMMHRRKDLWGPDAMEFDPDRFIDDRLNKYLTPNPFIFLPFNAGPRICLGQQFAYNETSFLLIRLLQRFDGITLDKSAQPPDSIPPASWKNASGRKSKEEIFPKCHLTMYSHKGLWVRMREAAPV